MNQIEFNQKIENFNATLPERKKELSRLEEMTAHFIRKFPIDAIPSMKMEDYIIGYGDNDNFCHWLERRMVEIGNMRGATSFKFGLYFGRTKSDPIDKFRYRKRFTGIDEQEVYRNVNQEIVKLLDAGKSKNLDALVTNQLSTMFKGKILATYFPEFYIHIYSEKHLNYFLNKLGLPTSGNAIFKREALRLFKENQPAMAAWSLIEYCKFLYFAFGHPPKSPESAEELEPDEQEEIFPNVEDMTPQFIDLTIHDASPANPKNKSGGKAPGKRDFLAENIRNKAYGDLGEQIVMKAEREWLLENGRADFVEDLEQVSLESDGYGFDIKSKELDGSVKHIEVKATKEKQGVVNFLITPNELQKSKELENYYVYIVFEVLSTTPKIWRWKSPFKPENPAVTITPVQYRVTANTSVFLT